MCLNRFSPALRKIQYPGGPLAQAALSHFFSFTNLADTGATAGESVYANIVRNGPAMMATYVLS